MNECPYVGIKFDVMTDVIISVFAFLNVRRVFNKMSVRLCIGRSEPYLVWLGGRHLSLHHLDIWADIRARHACFPTAVFLGSSVLLLAYLSIKPCWQHSRHWRPQVVAWQWSSTAAQNCGRTSVLATSKLRMRLLQDNVEMLVFLNKNGYSEWTVTLTGRY